MKKIVKDADLEVMVIGMVVVGFLGFGVWLLVTLGGN